MKRSNVLAGLACAIAVATFAHADSNAPMHPDATALSAATVAAIDKAVATDLKGYGGNTPVPGAVVGIWDPKLGVLQKTYGLGRLSPKEPMALTDKFRIGSNTKTFVVTVLLQLADEGKLKLSDTLDKFTLPVKVPNASHITLAELCEMRSGLLNLYSLPEFQNEQFTSPDFNVLKYTQDALNKPALFPPGTKYDYSNTNYILLGLVIEAVTHDTTAHQIETRLIQPLHLTATTYPTIDRNMPSPYAHGYMLNDKKGWDDTSVALPAEATGAAGVMISDMADMKTWVKAYVTGSTNSKASQAARLDCKPTPKPKASFGLGIGCSAGWYGYTGGIPGYNTSAYFLPATGTTVVVLVNSQRELEGKPDVATAIWRDIARILHPEHAPL
jgi:D-alanyl-D-alanine carboxypeptidase